MLKLYGATPFEVKPPTSNHRIAVRVSKESRSHSKTIREQQSSPTDEFDYIRRHVASSGSLFFRRQKTYPRSFLWRVLEDGHVLEVQCADISKGENEKEADLTLVLEFQDAISSRNVIFADKEGANEIHVFLLTSKNQVFDLRLTTEVFRDPELATTEVSKLCTPIVQSALTVDSVYQLHAADADHLFVSFASGSLQRWNRNPDVAAGWSATNYSDRSWGASIRGLVTRRGPPPIDFDGMRLYHSTAHAMVTSPDMEYLFALCLNHNLRVWHLGTGNLVDERDLLDVSREPQERLQLNPSEPGFIRFVEHELTGERFLATYSPHQGGQFKIWLVQEAPAGSLSLHDRFPDQKLSPPDPDPTGNTIWSLAGFEIVSGNEIQQSQIWVLWRNYNYFQLYTLQFNMAQLAESWETDWVNSTSTSTSASAKPKPPNLVLADVQDITSSWLDFFFFPGRFSTALLEAALSRYQTLTEPSKVRVRGEKSLRERMCTAVGADVALRKYENTGSDFERFSADTDHQWRNFWRIVDNMNENRYAPLSLAFDTFTEMTWVVMADFCCAIRECSDIEILQHNEVTALEVYPAIGGARWPHRKIASDQQKAIKVARLLLASSNFSRSFSPELTYELVAALEEDLFTESDVATPVRIVNIYNEVDFANAVSPEAESELAAGLASIGGIPGLDGELVEEVLSLVSKARQSPKNPLTKTHFGSLLFAEGVLQTIVSIRRILFDLLALTVFVDDSERFDAARLFDELIDHLRVQERNYWLATNWVTDSVTSLMHINASEESASHGSASTKSLTVLEDIFGQAVRPQPAINRPLTYLITDHINENLSFISGSGDVSSEHAAVHLQCYLLKKKQYQLATSFLRFQPSTPWSTYVKARLRLKSAQYAEASVYFRQATFSLACGKALGDLQEMSAHLIDENDAEFFNSGIARYYQHVAGLFETEKAYVQMAEFARLALQDLSLDKHEPGSQFRQEMLSRLFTAELKGSRFEAAYEAMVQFPNEALQRSSAVQIIDALLAPKISLTNGAGVLSTIQKLPWSLYPHLLRHVDDHLAQLAKKQNSVPGLGGLWSSNSNVDYLSILHALKLSRRDFRGAVGVLYDRLRIIQRSSKARHDPQATMLRHAFLVLINAMTCVAPDEAYILADIESNLRSQISSKRLRAKDDDEKGGAEGGGRKRRRMIITLSDLRRQYQQTLDRCNRIERGDFDFDFDPDGDTDAEDEEDAMDMDVSTNPDTSSTNDMKLSFTS